MDRIATRKDPLGNSESYQYDLDGNLAQFTDRRGKVTTFKYDAVNRRIFAGFGTTAGPAYESTINYSYDAGDRLIQAADSVTGTISRSYDGLDRLTSEVSPRGSVNYAYDAAGRRTSMAVSGQTAIAYGFDNANRLTQISQGSGNVSFGYDSDSRRTSLTLPNGVSMNYSYDAASQLSGISYKNGSTTLGNLTYAYDLAGRRAGVGGTYARTNTPQAASPASYNVNNQLTQWKGASLSYDANGNLTSDGTNTYTWNARNQLVAVSGGVSASFQYDPFGRRVSKTIGGTTQFLYDGVNPVQEISGTTASANLLTGGVDEYFQRTDSAGARNLLTDALGSTLALADSTGAVQTSYTFEPFGNTTVTGVATTNSFAYTGRELDTTGLYFYRARYYNPSLQRFIAEDPIAFAGGENLYTYVGDSPTNFWDPLGLIRDPAGFPIGRLPAAGGGEAPKTPIAGRKKTCLQVFLNTALHPDEGPLGPDFENVAQNVQAGFQALGAGVNFLAIDVHNGALDYGASLSAAAAAAGTISYPFRSAIFRGLINLSENLSSLSESLSSEAVVGEGGLVALDILLANALANEVEAVRSGECIPEGVALKRIIFNQ